MSTNVLKLVFVPYVDLTNRVSKCRLEEMGRLGTLRAQLSFSRAQPRPAQPDAQYQLASLA